MCFLEEKILSVNKRIGVFTVCFFIDRQYSERRSMKNVGNLKKVEVINVVKEKYGRKRFVRYKTGAELYDMSQSSFEELSEEAGAKYKIGKMVLVSCDIFEEYLETFHVSNRE